MRKALVIFVSLTLAVGLFALAGCSSSGSAPSSSSGPQYADQDFIASVSKGLEARWDLSSKDTDDTTSAKEMQSYIQAELDQLTPYESATFEDTKLQEKALKYINVLKDSYENVNYSLSDKDYDKWLEYIDQRAVLIKSFVEDYGLTVSERNQATLDEFLANGQAVEARDAQEEAVNKLVKKLKFELVEDDGYGWKTYAATLNNKSDYDIVNISLDISLLDKDETIIETQYASVDNVKQGKKAKVEFQTNTEFESLETTVNYFEVK